MSIFFPRFQEFSPLFRLADEIEKASRTQQHCAVQRSFAPRFDVKETQETYELNGELPGVDQSNINIEWSDDFTLTVSGRSEKVTKKTNEKAATAEASDKASEAEFVEVESEPENNYHSPTVEDDGAAESSAAAEEKTATKTEESQAAAQPQEPKSRYWITERSYGSFNRTFKFPARVETDAVSASLNNGVLNIVVPKAKAREPRKIVIQ
jgi:HSP20 family protein